MYYLPHPVPDADLAIMQRFDRLHLEYPFAGSPLLIAGCKIGRRHAKTLMGQMGIEAPHLESSSHQVRHPRTTKPEPGHKLYPFLLRDMAIITYIAMAYGFVYLAVALDWATRRVLSWQLPTTMEAAF